MAKKSHSVVIVERNPGVWSLTCGCGNWIKTMRGTRAQAEKAAAAHERSGR